MILADPMLGSRRPPFLRKVGRAPEQLSAVSFKVRLSPVEAAPAD